MTSNSGQEFQSRNAVVVVVAKTIVLVKDGMWAGCNFPIDAWPVIEINWIEVNRSRVIPVNQLQW